MANCRVLLYQTEVLKQLSAMGRLVVCAGNGAVQSITNLYVLGFLFAFFFSLSCPTNLGLQH